MTEGVHYASETIVTAAAELAFHRLLFYAESPATPWPANSAQFTVFSAGFATAKGLDLTRSPLDSDREKWRHPSAYEHCQTLADAARSASIGVIRYESVRDPAGGMKLALLTCGAFSGPEPRAWQTWRIYLRASGVQAICEFPQQRLAFDRTRFDNDARFQGMNWDR